MATPPRRSATATVSEGVDVELSQMGTGTLGSGHNGEADAEMSKTASATAEDAETVTKILGRSGREWTGEVSGGKTMKVGSEGVGKLKKLFEARSLLDANAKQLHGIPFALAVYNKAHAEAFEKAKGKAAEMALDTAKQAAKREVESNLVAQIQSYAKERFRRIVGLREHSAELKDLALEDAVKSTATRLATIKAQKDATESLEQKVLQKAKEDATDPWTGRPDAKAQLSAEAKAKAMAQAEAEAVAKVTLPSGMYDRDAVKSNADVLVIAINSGWELRRLLSWTKNRLINRPNRPRDPELRAFLARIGVVFPDPPEGKEDEAEESEEESGGEEDSIEDTEEEETMEEDPCVAGVVEPSGAVGGDAKGGSDVVSSLSPQQAEGVAATCPSNPASVIVTPPPKPVDPRSVTPDPVSVRKASAIKQLKLELELAKELETLAKLEADLETPPLEDTRETPPPPPAMAKLFTGTFVKNAFENLIPIDGLYFPLSQDLPWTTWRPFQWISTTMK
eukprot:Skav228825  [mRNA]  locus=scaffold359:534558:546440:+ [translate_table: standard]